MSSSAHRAIASAACRARLSTDRSQHRRFLLPRLLKTDRGITLRRLRLIELLGRHIGLARKRPKPVSGAGRKLKVRLRTFDLFGCDRRVRFFGRYGWPPRIESA